MKQFSYPEDGHDVCFDLEDRSFWFIRRNEVIKNVVSTHLLSGLFVDVGGGNGFVSKMLEDSFPRLDVAMVEPGEHGCINAKSRGVSQVYNCTFEEYQNNGRVQNVGLFDVVEHIEDDIGFLKSINKRMELGGKVFITVPSYQFLWSGEDVLAEHYRRYRVSDFYRIASLTGYKLAYRSYFFATLIPLIFLLRSIPWRLGASQKVLDTEASHSSGVVTKLLELFLLLEEKIRRIVGSMPIGASLIVVLEKTEEM